MLSVLAALDDLAQAIQVFSRPGVRSADKRHSRGWAVYVRLI
jgi:hypothetical protein